MAFFAAPNPSRRNGGIPLRVLITEALADKVRAENGGSKPWMAALGKLRQLRRETAKISRIIEEEFE